MNQPETTAVTEALKVVGQAWGQCQIGFTIDCTLVRGHEGYCYSSVGFSRDMDERDGRFLFGR